MKQLLATLILSTALVFFAGCGDDDNNNVEYYNDLHECMQGSYTSKFSISQMIIDIDSIEIGVLKSQYTWINDTTINTNLSGEFKDYWVLCNDSCITFTHGSSLIYRRD